MCFMGVCGVFGFRRQPEGKMGGLGVFVWVLEKGDEKVWTRSFHRMDTVYTCPSLMPYMSLFVLLHENTQSSLYTGRGRGGAWRSQL